MSQAVAVTGGDRNSAIIRRISLIVHSFAGDDPIVCRDYVRQRLGLEPFKPNRGKAGRTNTYEYRDPVTCEIRYRKERIESADGTKTFIIKPRGRNGSAPLLYGAERLADLREGQPVFVVEGEKKVDRLHEFGAVAVCADSGAPAPGNGNSRAYPASFRHLLCDLMAQYCRIPAMTRLHNYILPSAPVLVCRR